MMRPDEAEAIHCALRNGAFGEIADQVLMAQAIDVLANSWFRELVGVEMQGQLGAPDWLGYELRLWELGEELRSLFKAKRWKGRGPLLDQIASLLSERKLGKGRQTLAILLGEFGGSEYASALSGALDDPAVWGHAVKALTKGRVPGQGERVQRIAAEADGWVRRSAQRYLKELGDSSGD